MQVGFVTDQGGSKKENEDSFLVDTDRGIFIVADGLGGHNAGKCASKIAIEEISLFLSQNLVPEKSAMGSTVVVALLQENRFLVSNVGDSRAYLIKDGFIKQLSEDHTFVAEWVKSGTITKEEARNHEARRGLWMALGVEGDVQPYSIDGAWNSDSCLLLCSDGLTDVVEDNEILRLVNQSKDAQDACEQLLIRAKELGTSDHVTVLIACGQC
ncbi:MAG: SpoIIE family protein phosphatase [Deltaproteobacteria bacterium]|nr:SpoIIE family protein phosphatase [Deltaproteobacteria bacterium]